jgi:N6-adenosine-specific RNA methylase IME4
LETCKQKCHTLLFDFAEFRRVKAKNMDKYQLIYCDPPWLWKARSSKGEGRSAKNHYSVMTLDDIKCLPVAKIAEKDSVLLMWAIDPMLPQALEVIQAWGYTYKTVAFYWAKTNTKSEGFAVGCGYYTRANPEMCLLATKGKGLSRVSKSVRRLVVAPRGRHSEKPDEVRKRIVQLFGDVSRIELFARMQVPGWIAWGNEVENSTLFISQGE